MSFSRYNFGERDLTWAPVPGTAEQSSSDRVAINSD